MRARLCLLAFILALTCSAHAQGCAACRDNVAGSSPKVRSSFRKAIPVLGVPAMLIFAGALWIGLRSREENGDSDE
jgi:hypothetical protein